MGFSGAPSFGSPRPKLLSTLQHILRSANVALASSLATSGMHCRSFFCNLNINSNLGCMKKPSLCRVQGREVALQCLKRTDMARLHCGDSYLSNAVKYISYRRNETEFVRPAREAELLPFHNIQSARSIFVEVRSCRHAGSDNGIILLVVCASALCFYATEYLLYLSSCSSS